MNGQPVKYVLGQVTVPQGDVQYIKFAATVMPFIAFIGGIFVGYLLVRPTLLDIQYMIGVAKQVFPIFGVRDTTR